MAKHNPISLKGTNERRSSLDRRGKQHRRVEKKPVTGPRRSARLRTIRAPDQSREESDKFPSPTSNIPSRESPHHRTVSARPSGRKRKRQQEFQDESSYTPAGKRPRTRPKHREKSSDVRVANAIDAVNPVEYWAKEGRWPKKYFEQDDQTRAYLTRDLDEESWLEKYWWPNMDHVLARKKSSSSLRRMQSEPGSSAPSSTTPSEKPREEKSSPYNHVRYEVLLGTKSVFMDEDDEGPERECREFCRKLLEADRNVPEVSRFSETVFRSTCRRLRKANEAKVIDKIGRLIVPSAEDLADFGLKHLRHLAESINEGWNNSIPLTKPRPQPDYAVGFDRSAFTQEQLKKLQPFVGELTDTSYFMGTYYMYFPFFTCEVKCGAAALDIADRQNAHSMTLAVRGVVELFRLANREKEVDRQIIAFSVSHDHRTVRIYGHYPVIDGKETTYYRHPIHTFDFTALEGKERWTTYKFTKNVYDVWMPDHFKRLCSVIDELPANLSFELSEQSDLQFQESGLSQDLESYNLSQQSHPDSLSLQGDSQATASGPQDATPDTSVSQGHRPFKKPRKRPAVG
ncbi:hypothetical protein P154DRAFT_349514 [Amniculicola lignicola CBS 123094]|uniref:DUF7924 domain-containing protein n=1 Tax=Amniculicola lignicola CBS 123094 TaxID=1392246 RepID=A0A6A5W2Q6_9PLEO|nr:hypothetical protein P154DRAFT_349514 [Amniculicola lignicola CBS 123094]